MAIHINNYSRPIGKRGRNDYYQWRVFVDEPFERLEQIERVEYLLHPTFPEPQQIRTNPSDRFALETSGWGEFPIQVVVTYKNGTQDRTRYELKLSPTEKPWPQAMT